MALDELAIKHGTDKSSKHHGYAVIYEKYFEPLRHEKIVFCECGIGGYEYPDRGGEGLRMWREYFSNAIIAGIDINPKSFKIPGVELYQYSQTDERLKKLCEGVNIFIDDASHINLLTIETFTNIFSVLAPGAFYVIEDIESSWCPADGWAAGCNDPFDLTAYTTINYCRMLLNDLNGTYSGMKRYDIDFIHFYQNLVIIKKK